MCDVNFFYKLQFGFSSDNDREPDLKSIFKQSSNERYERLMNLGYNF